MKRFLPLFATIALQASPSFAAGEYLAALRCQDEMKADYGEADAAVICRGAVNANVTAIFNCADEAAARKVAPEVSAVLCQGIDYQITTATWNCFSQAIDDGVSARDAAVLCQKTSYALYTAKFHCLDSALESMTAANAAVLCGGIGQ